MIFKGKTKETARTFESRTTSVPSRRCVSPRTCPPAVSKPNRQTNTNSRGCLAQVALFKSAKHKHETSSASPSVLAGFPSLCSVFLSLLTFCTHFPERMPPKRRGRNMRGTEAVSSPNKKEENSRESQVEVLLLLNPTTPAPGGG